MEIICIKQIFINEVASWCGACGCPHYFPPTKAFVAVTDKEESFYTTIGGTEVFSVCGNIPSGAYENELRSCHETSCAIPITTEMQFREVVETIIENHYKGD